MTSLVELRVLEGPNLYFPRKAANYYARSTGHMPPGLGADRFDPDAPEPAA
ncbi:hypothetical protein [Streptomyces rhizosphaericus]|uniref:hypothetical protein n=1 Tax=Streptomyces rhizosphaericus TaxID=114699 RepID=UPI0031D78198